MAQSDWNPENSQRSVAAALVTGCVLTLLSLYAGVLSGPTCQGATYEVYPSTADAQEEFETLANGLKPGDVLILHGGTYSQNARRAVTASGTADAPIVIRAVPGETPLLTRPADQIDRYNNIEFIDCSHLVIRGIRFQGGSSGVRFIRGHHVTFEDCEVFETGNNALTMNSGNCDSFVIRRNHLHHTGLSTSRPTEGEGMYIGCHDGSCITTNTLVEGNYIHHLRSTSNGGNDGIEIKAGSHGNAVRNNVIHDTNMIFVNNAVYCPSGTAIDASEIMDAIVSANYVQGRLLGTSMDSVRFCEGRTAVETFTDPERSDFWPRSDSALIGHADGGLIPERDFNDAVRRAPYDVGAYECEGRTQNPGWKVQAGFKR